MELKFQDDLIPAIVQDPRTGKVLMLGYMNQAAYQQTLETGFVTFYSRSRQKLWIKGEQSGHRLSVREICVDCDQDAVLVKAELSGPGCCHEGYETCFYRKVTPAGVEVIEQRQFDPAEVYKN
ncbi:MAG: phosphoribosyl-AMP cyclohydrolase [Acidobacteriota bacterium]|nr:phosphoribosyl-AMP cyclohydrolase [Acidobacteriota bacterium]